MRLAKLVGFPWLGNVRRLDNEGRRALLADGSIDIAELSAELVQGGSAAARGADSTYVRASTPSKGKLVVETLTKARGNQTSCATPWRFPVRLQKTLIRLKIKPHVTRGCT